MNLLTVSSNKVLAMSGKKFDFLKFQVKTKSIQCFVSKKKDQENRLQLYEWKLKRLLNKIQDNYKIFSDESNQQEIYRIQEEIDKILDKKVQGAIICSRVDWHLYGEKPSSYFFKLEKYNYTRKNRYCIIKLNRDLTTDPKEILIEQHNFYAKPLPKTIKSG